MSIVSLGCPKNLVDSESMTGRLQASGYVITTDEPAVDLFLLNTCGFLRSARAEAEEYIQQALKEKAAGNIERLVVTGCAVVSDGAELAASYPEVDAWIGPNDERRIIEIVDSLLEEPESADAERVELNVLTAEEADSARAQADAQPSVAAPRLFLTPTKQLTLDDTVRATLTEPHVAYLKIADGCDRFCSYCAIPKIRGRYVSKPFETILDESRALADRGVRELVLIAQETTFWGADLYGKPDLARLLAALKDRNDFDWIRVLYTYPLFWEKELTSLFKLEESGTTSILPYIDIPLQHCNSELLRRMNRRVDKVETEELIARLREEIPDVVLRTTFIVGFPGETDEMFHELVDFVERSRFERAGVFQFSPEPGVPASSMPDQVDEKTKSRRLARLFARQERISHQFARELVGTTLDVLLDSRAIAENGEPMKNVCVGRTRADAPDVDPVVYVTGRNLKPGEMLPCEIVDVAGLDLVAIPADPKRLFIPKSEGRRKSGSQRKRRNKRKR
jgi:ribosomal protein S12 methylthiotransferase